jgi:hypothetical protein
MVSIRLMPFTIAAGGEKPDKKKGGLFTRLLARLSVFRLVGRSGSVEPAAHLVAPVA